MKCNYCRQDLTGFEAVATSCGHVFCKAHAATILDTAHPCPVCKAVLTEGDMHSIRVGAGAEHCKVRGARAPGRSDVPAGVACTTSSR